MKKSFILTLLMGTMIGSMYAQQQVYTLDECRSRALENNVKMRNATNTVEAARQGKKEAFTNYFPNVSATGMGYVSDNGLVEMEVQPGVNMAMMKNGIMGGVTLTQPVFAGGKIVNGNRLAEVGVEVSRLQQEQTENEVLLTVEQYYWQVVTLQEKWETLLSVEKMLDRICSDAEAAVRAGVATRNELLQAQLKQNEIESTRVNLENNLSICRMLLAQYIGLSTDTIGVASHIPVDVVPEFPQELLQDHATALANTPEYRLLESNVKASKLQQKMAVGKQLPTVAVGAGYLYHNLMEKDHPFAVGFVSVSVPLSGWWGGSHAIKKQKLEVKNAENQLADNAELLVIRMQKAWSDVQDAYKQIQIAHKSIEQSTENLRLNEDYYRAGTTTMSELLDAQTLYRQSHDKYIDAYSRFKIKTVEYLLTTGN